MPPPAPLSTSTLWPWSTSSRTLPGTSPTRYSCVFISFGTPTSIVLSLCRCLEHVGERAEQRVDLFLVDDERRRQRDDVAGGADQHPLVVTGEEGIEGALRRLAGDGIELDAADDAKIAHVDDIRQAAHRMRRLLPIGRERCCALEQPLILI